MHAALLLCLAASLAALGAAEPLAQTSGAPYGYARPLHEPCSMLSPITGAPGPARRGRAAAAPDDAPVFAS